MPYIIETWDKTDGHDLRLATRDEHLIFLDEMKQKLLACGAKLSDDGNFASGGLYIVDVETREDAQILIHQDPFFKAGLFQKITITNWRKAYLDGKSYL